jgi:putative oxidoreductase
VQLIPRLLAPDLTVTLARLGFAAVLLPWFVIGGLSKIAGLTLSVGPPAGVWPLSLAFLPDVMAEGAAPTLGQHAFVLSMTLSELVLPLMVVAGLGGWISAALLIVHVWIASLATGRLMATGSLFDASPFDPGPDQVVLWTLVLLPVAVQGAGPISIDGLLARLRNGRSPTR